VIEPLEPEAMGLPLRVASREDLIAMKLSAIAGRGLHRDFWDLHALMEGQAMALPQALQVFQRKYAQEDLGHVVRSLVYFSDADAEPMPAGMTAEMWARIRADFEAWVRRA
jgi:predicted nucleotidyltransferase component of viral defense system